MSDSNYEEQELKRRIHAILCPFGEDPFNNNQNDYCVRPLDTMAFITMRKLENLPESEIEFGDFWTLFNCRTLYSKYLEYYDKSMGTKWEFIDELFDMIFDYMTATHIMCEIRRHSKTIYKINKSKIHAILKQQAGLNKYQQKLNVGV